MARKHARNRSRVHTRGARIETQSHGVVTVAAVRRCGVLLVVRDRAGRMWDLRRAGSRWTVAAHRGGAA